MHNEKAQIAESYNKLYTKFCCDDIQEVGNYTIIKLIGSGAFGKVYLAMHKLTHTKVVLKTGSKHDPNLVREVFYHRQFKHPHITRLYELVICEGRVWLVLEYCPGKELLDYLLASGRVSVDETRKLFAQIVGAVYYAHSLHCIHRDLKLENILLDKKRNAKLSDFGFRRECEARNMLETICGTTVYMAPELIEKKKYDGFKIDIWSLGVILYTLLYGGMPFDEDNEMKTQISIVQEEPKFKIDIPQDAIQLMRKMLSKDPSKRPTAKEILLDKFLDFEGQNQLEISDTLVKNAYDQRYFSSKTEKNLLKKLKSLGIDTHAMKKSVINKQCDSLSGLYELLLEKEKKKESKKYKARSRSVLRITASSTTRRVSQLMDPISTPQLSRMVSLRSQFSQKDTQSLMNGSETSPEKKKTTFLQKMSKLLKINKKDDSNTHPIGHSRMNSIATSNITHTDQQKQSPDQNENRNNNQIDGRKQSIVIKEPSVSTRLPSGNAQRTRPASVLSQQSAMSSFTAMSDLSTTSLTTDNDTPTVQRPSFIRKSSTENSIKQTRRSLSIISSNSSASEKSSALNSLYDTSHGPDIRVVQFSRGRRFNDSIFPRSAARRGRSPLGKSSVMGIPPSSSKFKRSKASVIEEDEEGDSVEDLEQNIASLDIAAKSSDFEDDSFGQDSQINGRGRTM